MLFSGTKRTSAVEEEIKKVKLFLYVIEMQIIETHVCCISWFRGIAINKTINYAIILCFRLAKISLSDAFQVSEA